MNKQVELAKDVLKTIELENIIIKAGAYFTVVAKDDYRYTMIYSPHDKYKRLMEYGLTISSLLSKSFEEKSKCEVCAMGAMLAARCKEESVVDLLETIEEPLLKYFDLKSLALIELAFEGTCVGLVIDSDLFDEEYLDDDNRNFISTSDPALNISADEVNLAKEFWGKNKNPKERLQKIMQHIIDNGKFHLEVLCE